MIAKLKKLGRFKITVLLFFMTLFCFGVSVARYVVTDTVFYLFLNWNLFLAFIPWVISSFIVYKGIEKKRTLLLLVFVWLLFFPNSPYIFTDLFHLRTTLSAPIWYDLIMILSFAWTGLIFGFISLMDIEKLSKKYLSTSVINILIVCFMFLSSFGIYLGRYLRWNSWDLLTNPMKLLHDVVFRFIDPLSYPRTWAMTAMMGILLSVMYFSIKFMKEEKEDGNEKE